MRKGGRYIDTGQYDHHVWLWHMLHMIQTDLICYGTCFTMVTADGIELLDPREVIIHEQP